MKTSKAIMTLLFSTSVMLGFSQIKNAKTESVKINGNCGMCKTTIEKAGNKKKLAKVDWNKDTKTAIITYNSKSTTKDAILKRIALVGYDNELYLAPDAVYSNLHGCCQYERDKKITAKVDTVKNEVVNNNTTISTTKSELTAVFDTYFLLKDALVESDGAKAALKASELIKVIKAVKMEKLSTEEHTVWMKNLSNLQLDAGHIAETKDASHQRDHFTSLSTNMYELIKVSKHNEAIYYQNCPMFNNGKGANWLSKENAIKNPYYGSMMLSCGKTVETLK